MPRIVARYYRYRKDWPSPDHNVDPRSQEFCGTFKGSLSHEGGSEADHGGRVAAMVVRRASQKVGYCVFLDVDVCFDNFVFLEYALYHLLFGEQSASGCKVNGYGIPLT